MLGIALDMYMGHLDIINLPHPIQVTFQWAQYLNIVGLFRSSAHNQVGGTTILGFFAMKITQVGLGIIVALSQCF